MCGKAYTILPCLQQRLVSQPLVLSKQLVSSWDTIDGLTQDMCQAYLHGEVTAEEALPVRYPKGLERSAMAAQMNKEKNSWAF